MGVRCISVKMKSLLKAVDEESWQILTYLLRERHAEIRELADLVSASSDMEVLIKIKKVINEKAREILGVPILTFKHCKTDPLTNEKITFSWWLREDVIDYLFPAELFDIFDEKDILRVITFIPSHDKKVEVKVEDGFLTISGKEYHREVPLSCPVEKETTQNLNNGILEVILKKVG